MQHLWSKILLLIYGLMTLLFREADTSFVFAFLTGIILSSAGYFFDSRRFTFWASLIYAATAFFIPAFYCFLPLILYDLLRYRTCFPLGFSIFGFFIRPIGTYALTLYLILGFAVCAALMYQSSSQEKLVEKLRRTRDDGTEQALLLKEKKSVTYEIYTATLKERNRIAREIHDNVGHLLSRSILMTGALKAVNQSDSLSEPLEQLTDTLTLAMDSIRVSVHDLYDDSINLKEVLKELTESFDFCPVTLDYDIMPDVPREIKLSFISIVKEALSNIIRHSNADCVHITAREHPALYQLVVEDNGTNIHILDSGIGLQNMKDRIAAFGGTIQIQTDSGFRIFITLPKTTA